MCQQPVTFVKARLQIEHCIWFTPQVQRKSPPHRHLHRECCFSTCIDCIFLSLSIFAPCVSALVASSRMVVLVAAFGLVLPNFSIFVMARVLNIVTSLDCCCCICGMASWLHHSLANHKVQSRHLYLNFEVVDAPFR